MGPTSNKVKTYVEYILELDPNGYSRLSDFGTSGAFSRSYEAITYAQSICALINFNRLELIPDNRLNVLASNLELFIGTLSTISNFDPKDHSNPESQRIALQEQLDRYSHEIYDAIAPVLGVMAVDPHINDALNELISTARGDISSSVVDLVQNIEQKAESASAIVDEMRGQIGEIAAASQAIHFENEANRFKNSASKWLVAAVISFLILLLYATIALFISFEYDYSRINSALSAQLIFGKLMVAAVLGYAASICGKTYLSNRHNEAVNRHRQNALMAFRALAEATSAPSERDIIIGQAAQAVFAPQDTGFIKTASSTSADLNPTVINAVPRMVGGAG